MQASEAGMMLIPKYKDITSKAVKKHMDAFAKFTSFSDNRNAINRLAYSKEENAAAKYFFKQLSSCCANVRSDFAGNVLGSIGSQGKQIIVGSHLDSVKDGGCYDGTTGIIAALLITKALSERPLNYTLTAVGWSGEESVSFGIPYIGSKLAAGTLDIVEFDRQHLLNAGNQPLWNYLARLNELKTRNDVFQAYLGTRKISKDNTAAYFELHIEQGPVLDNEGYHVAAVNSISGNYRFTITFSGKPGHTGALPAKYKQKGHGADEAATEFAYFLIQAANSLNKKEDHDNLTDLRVSKTQTFYPKGMNRTSMPPEIGYYYDARSMDGKKLVKIKNIVEKLSNKMGVKWRVDTKIVEVAKGIKKPIALDDGILGIINSSIGITGYSMFAMPSGAGHDTEIFQNMGIPSGMVFVPSIEGVSHHPSENTSIADIVIGTQVMLESIIKFDENGKGKR